MKPEQAALPTFADVLAAQARIRPYLPETPLRNYRSLDRLLGAEVWVKHENQQPTGVFKVRGGLNLVGQLDPEEKRRGVITASTGNHGQSVAYAARQFGVKATICMPENPNPIKRQAIRDFGAEVIESGRRFDDAREECERIAAAKGLRYIHSGNEPLLIAGVATATLEILASEPDVDWIIVPLGGGSGAAGASIVAKTMRPATRVVAVQSERAPAAYRSWQQRRIISAENNTIAEGLATGVGFELPQRILWEKLDDFLLVSDDEIRRAMLLLIEHTRNLIEAAGAAALAGALKLAKSIRGSRVAIIVSGGNITLQQLRDLLEWDVQSQASNKRETNKLLTQAR